MSLNTQYNHHLNHLVLKHFHPSKENSVQVLVYVCAMAEGPEMGLAGREKDAVSAEACTCGLGVQGPVLEDWRWVFLALILPARETNEQMFSFPGKSVYICVEEWELTSRRFKRSLLGVEPDPTRKGRPIKMASWGKYCLERDLKTSIKFTQ